MLVSNNKAGLLIGKGGCVISHLRQTLPGAKMSVLDAGAPLYLWVLLMQQYSLSALLSSPSTLYARTASVYCLAT
jgi:hypothetical protein